LERRDARLEVGLVVLRRVVFGVLGDVSELARDADALRDLAAAVRRQILDLGLELLEAVRRENDFLQHVLLAPCTETAAGEAPRGGGGWYPSRRTVVKREPDTIGGCP